MKVALEAVVDQVLCVLLKPDHKPSATLKHTRDDASCSS